MAFNAGNDFQARDFRQNQTRKSLSEGRLVLRGSCALEPRVAAPRLPWGLNAFLFLP